MKLIGELTKGMNLGRSDFRRAGKGNLYLSEEPIIGLHLGDCEKPLGLFHRLVDQAHAVIVIERKLNVLEDVDSNEELRPKGGSEGDRNFLHGTSTEPAGMSETP